MINLQSYLYFYIIVAVFYLYVIVTLIHLAIQEKMDNNRNQIKGVMTEGYTGLLKGVLAINITLTHFEARIPNIMFPYRSIVLLGGPSVTAFLCIAGYVETFLLAKKRC